MEPVKPKAPGIAVASLILGILGFLTCLLTGIPAIITGHLAQRKIKASGGALGGGGMALTGTILGYVTTASTVLLIPLAAIVTPAVLKANDRATEMTNIANASQVHVALLDYSLDNENRFPPNLETMIASGHLPDPLVLNHRGASKGNITSWTYYPGLDSADYSSIILAGPATGDPPTRIVVFVDGSVKPLREAEAQRKASAQGITLP